MNKEGNMGKNPKLPPKPNKATKAKTECAIEVRRKKMKLRADSLNLDKAGNEIELIDPEEEKLHAATRNKMQGVL